MNKRAFRHIKNRIKGFTLVELMVTLAILVILLAIGVPQLRVFLDKQKVAADAESLESSIKLARSEAIKRSGQVSICPIATAGVTPPTCNTAAQANWSNGWLVFIDYTNSAGFTGGDYDPSTDTILRQEQAIRSGSITSSAPNAVISYRATGISTASAGTFTINPSASGSSPNTRCFSVSFQGKFAQSTCV